MAGHFPVDPAGHNQPKKEQQRDAKEQRLGGQTQTDVKAPVLQGNTKGRKGDHGQHQPIQPDKGKPNHRQNGWNRKQNVLFQGHSHGQKRGHPQARRPNGPLTKHRVHASFKRKSRMALETKIKSMVPTNAENPETATISQRTG